MSLTLDSLLNIEPFSWVALLCCAVNGLLIGAERQTRGKPVCLDKSLPVWAF